MILDRKVAIVLSIMILSSTMLLPASDAESGSFTVTDGYGNEYLFDGPVDDIVAIGRSVTSTIIGVGGLDRIVVCDSYSVKETAMNEKETTLFRELCRNHQEGKVYADGDLTGSGRTELRKDIISAVNQDRFDSDKGVILIVSDEKMDFLNDLGRVIQWKQSVSSFDEICGFAESISMICNGYVTKDVKDLRELPSLVDGHLTDSEKKSGLFVTYQNGIKVGRYGSLQSLLIRTAGGDTPVESGGGTMETDLKGLLDSTPGSIVFTDMTFRDEDHYNELRDAVGDRTPIVIIDSVFDYHSIMNKDTVEEICISMYPGMTFDYKEETTDVPEDDGMTGILLFSGILSLSLITLFLFLRRK